MTDMRENVKQNVREQGSIPELSTHNFRENYKNKRLGSKALNCGQIEFLDNIKGLTMHPTYMVHKLLASIMHQKGLTIFLG